MTRRYGLVSILVPLALLGCGKGGPPQGGGMPTPNVTLAMARSADVPVYLEEIGTCTAAEYVSIIPQVTGVITEIKFTDGADLHQNDPLFIIDPRPYQAALNQAQANADQASAALDLASREYDRYSNLLASHAVSQNDYDTRKNARDVADAQKSAASAAVETAKLNMEYCNIVSPIDGRAGQHKVDRGNVVKANEGSLLVIQKLDPIYADFTITERELPNVRTNSANHKLTVQTHLSTETQPSGEGDLTFIDTGVQDQAGTVKLRARLANADHHLWPGQFINARLILDVKKNAALVPAGAIQVGQTGPYVYVAVANPKDPKGLIAQLRPVKLGQRQGEEFVVEKGITAGERVVTTGQNSVIPDMPIKDVPMPAAMADSKEGAADAGGAPEMKSSVETRPPPTSMPAAATSRPDNSTDRQSPAALPLPSSRSTTVDATQPTGAVPAPTPSVSATTQASK